MSIEEPIRVVRPLGAGDPVLQHLWRSLYRDRAAGRSLALAERPGAPGRNVNGTASALTKGDFQLINFCHVCKDGSPVLSFQFAPVAHCVSNTIVPGVSSKIRIACHNVEADILVVRGSRSSNVPIGLTKHSANCFTLSSIAEDHPFPPFALKTTLRPRNIPNCAAATICSKRSEKLDRGLYVVGTPSYQ